MATKCIAIFICVYLFGQVYSAQFRGPPCDTEDDCPSNAACIVKVCECNENYMLNGDWTKCLPVLPIPYNETMKCEEDYQCTPTMSAGAICSEGQCVCKDAYHYLHGICHRSSGLDEACKTNDDCYESYSYDALKCGSTNLCECADGFYKVDAYQTCRKEGKNVGDECLFDIDCTTPGLYCNTTINQCVENPDQMIVVPPYTVPRQSGTWIGNTCSVRLACKPSNKMECIHNECLCKPGYSQYNNNRYCMSDLGEECTDGSECAHIEHAECGSNNTCRCKLPYVKHVNNRECRMSSMDGEECEMDEQCMYMGGGAACLPDEKSRLSCSCRTGHHYEDSIKLCILDIELSETCYNDYDCITANSSCQSKSCQCNPGHHESNDQCIPNPRALGDYCLTTSDCVSLPNTECLSNECLCAPGYFNSDDGVTCLLGLTGMCIVDTDCSVNNSICQKQECLCTNETRASSTNKCLYVRERGEECEEDIQCSDLLGEEGGACLGGRCDCKNGYQYRDNFCWDIRYPADPCKTDNQCYLKSGHLDRVKCENGFCKCDDQYRQTPDLDCRSGLRGICTVDADCSENNSICQEQECVCNNATRASTNYSCLYVRERGEECEEDIQCSDQLGEEGGACLGGRCDCKNGYQYRENFCWNIRYLGDPCENGSQCNLKSGHLDRVKCENGFCKCDDQFRQTLDLDCRSGLRGICTVDADCSENNSICQEQECVCNNATRASTNDSCLYVRERGEECEEDIQCSDQLGEEGGACLGGRCDCKNGYQYRENFCWNIRYLGDPCENGSQCNLKSGHLDRVKCENGFCKCDDQFRQTLDLDCRSGLRGICTVDADCSENNSICQEQECVCNNATRASTNDKCLYVRQRGEECEEDIQCSDLLGEEGGACLGGRCDCKNGYQYRDNFCWDIRYLGDPCEVHSQCYLQSGHLDRVNCENGFCKCDYQYQQTADLDCRSGLTGKCTVDDDCSVNNSICQEQECVCTNVTRASSNNKCLYVRQRGEECEEDIQCSDLLGEEGGACLGGRCHCKDGYYYRDNFCWDIRYLGDPCENDSQCYLKSGHLDRVKCENGFCKCDDQYRQTPDLDCRSVPVYPDLFRGPPCDTVADCPPSSATCSLKACQCNENYVFSGDLTKCLPVLLVPYDKTEKCEEDVQCSVRMNPGAICLEGQCVCKDAYHYLHGTCHKSSGLDEVCKVEDDCYENHSFEAFKCGSTNTCECADGFYMVDGYQTCRKEGKNVGDECLFDIDCTTPGLYCNTTINQCVENPDQRIIVPPYTESNQPGILYGTPCTSNTDCTPSSTMECFGNQCLCKQGYSYNNNNNYCLPDLGELCTNGSDCVHIKNAECGSDNTCRCKLPYVKHANNRECRIAREIGKQCQVDEQCIYMGGGVACLWNEEKNRMLCSCKPGHHYVDSIRLCVLDKELSETCYNDYDCNTSNSTCQSSICQCVSGYHDNNGKCIANVQALGDYCLSSDDCFNLSHTDCVSYQCSCASGYFNSDDGVTCLLGLTGMCIVDADCSVNNSICQEQECVCTNGTRASSNNKCLHVRERGEECEEDIQCSNLLGEKGGACLGGRCDCKDGYQYRDNSCWDIRYLGDPCEMHGQCYLKSGHLDRVNCENGFCKCDYQYQQTPDLDCRSGVGRDSASAAVIGLFFLIAVLNMRDGWTAGRP